MKVAIVLSLFLKKSSSKIPLYLSKMVFRKYWKIFGTVFDRYFEMCLKGYGFFFTLDQMLFTKEPFDGNPVKHYMTVYNTLVLI